MFITARVQWTGDGEGAEKWSRCRNSLFSSFQSHPQSYMCVGGEVGWLVGGSAMFQLFNVKHAFDGLFCIRYIAGEKVDMALASQSI